MINGKTYSITNTTGGMKTWKTFVTQKARKIDWLKIRQVLDKAEKQIITKKPTQRNENAVDHRSINCFTDFFWT